QALSHDVRTPFQLILLLLSSPTSLPSRIPFSVRAVLHPFSSFPCLNHPSYIYKSGAMQKTIREQNNKSMFE
ncbi:hypothetical protein C8Q78DRAFT_1040202, partial [Trametes maxima]